MNDCMETGVRDALPDLLHGRLSSLDRATVTAHVEGCADCRNELELLKQVRGSGPIVSRIDVARIVAALPAPRPSAGDLVVLPASDATRPARRWYGLNALAAAALLVVGGLTFATTRPGDAVVPSHRSSAAQTRETPSVRSQPAVAEAAAVSVATVPLAQRGAAERSRPASLSLSGGVQDLTDEQIETLLNDLDKAEAMPSAEPEAISIAADDGEGLQ